MPSWLLSIFSGLWGYLVAGVVSAGLCGWGIHSIDVLYYDAQISKLKLQTVNVSATQASNALQQLTSFVSSMNKAETDYQTSLDSISGHFVLIERQFKNATAKPLPVDCVPDDNRMHTLTAAIAATNSKDTAP